MFLGCPIVRTDVTLNVTLDSSTTFVGQGDVAAILGSNVTLPGGSNGSHRPGSGRPANLPIAPLGVASIKGSKSSSLVNYEFDLEG